MKLRYVTISDLHKNLPIESTIDLLKMSPIVELGIPVCPSVMMYGFNRNKWFNKLLDAAEQLKETINIALHVNYQWCDDMCDNVVPYEIGAWINRKNVHTQEPVIKRIQLNIGRVAVSIRYMDRHEKTFV